MIPTTPSVLQRLYSLRSILLCIQRSAVELHEELELEGVLLKTDPGVPCQEPAHVPNVVGVPYQTKLVGSNILPLLLGLRLYQTSPAIELPAYLVC